MGLKLGQLEDFFKCEMFTDKKYGGIGRCWSINQVVLCSELNGGGLWKQHE